ncbi:5-oxoprolinase subunit B family protein [Planctomonas psychrotolerans]|uniref:5-oxoprolinase subunit B family protein n=1 Tax=Planctomonas psychrotolerans TaxID=2528712 RepID=UPI00123990D7|nr:allophanate hydrolase subunit 1 [Planctomonas psychrotolerans]
MTRSILPYGDRALLVQVDSLEEVLALYPAVDATRPPGVVDVVPAARSILVTVEPGVLPLRRVQDWLSALPPSRAAVRNVEDAVVIDVVYSGPDLDEVARVQGVGADDVIAWHTGTPWRVAFSGFAPGFGYLTAGSGRRIVPRRAEPRPRVAAGSVGLAGEFSGVYPRESPGGWQLIGATRARLWDAADEHPALLMPGRTVRFRAIPP